MEAVRHRIVDSVPEWEESIARSRAAEEELATWLAMWPELRQKYPRQFVARVGDSIVAVDSDPVALLGRLEEMGLVGPEGASVEYVSDGTEKYIL